MRFAYKLLIATGCFVLGLPQAEASLTLAAEIGPTIVLSPKLGGTEVGFSAAGRFGYRIGVPLLELTPEVKVAVDTLPAGTDLRAIRAMAGGRLGIGKLLTPVVFAHFGYSSVSGGAGSAQSGTAFDIGGGLDFTPLPLVDVGAFIAYNRIEGDTDLTWLTIGAQATLVF